MPSRPTQSPTQLQDQLDDAEDRAFEMERRLQATLSSTSYRVGRALVSAARRPRTLWRLPSQLLRLYKGRSDPPETPQPAVPPPDRLLFRYRYLPCAGAGAGLAVIASRRTVKALGAAFQVVPLWPHDAARVAEAVSPAAVIVESGAAVPGEAWCSLGTALGVDLRQTLAGIIEGFQRRSVPVAFWWTTPPASAPELSTVAECCDALFSDDSVPGPPQAAPLSLGLDLREVDPAPPAANHVDSRPLLHLGACEPDPRHTPAGWLVEAAVAAGAEVRYEPGHLHEGDETLRPEEAPMRYRSAGWTTPTGAGLSHRCLAMLAAGVPVLTTQAPAGFAQVVAEVSSRADIAAGVEAASERLARPSAMAEALRAVHAHGTTAGRFGVALRRLGVELAEPCDDRIGVFAAGANPNALVAALRCQSIQPAEIVVDDPGLRETVRDALAPLGIPARPSETARAPRHAVWRGAAWSATHLQDLLIASRIAGTDRLVDDRGVVATTGPEGRERPLPWWLA